MKRRAYNGAVLRKFGNDEIHSEGLAKSLKCPAHGRDSGEVAGENDVFEPEIARGEYRHHRNCLGHHIDDAERDIAL